MELPPDARGAAVDDRSAERRVVLGKIVGAFGIAGWVKIASYTDPPDNILKYPMWQVSTHEAWQAMRHVDAERDTKGIRVRLEGIKNRTAAERLRGALIAVARSELPKLPPGQYYWDDLLGLPAFTPQDELLGTIEEIRAAPAHPILRIVGMRDAKRVEHLVPLVSDRVKKVDLDGGRVTLDWQSDW